MAIEGRRPVPASRLSLDNDVTLANPPVRSGAAVIEHFELLRVRLGEGSA